MTATLLQTARARRMAALASLEDRSDNLFDFDNPIDSDDAISLSLGTDVTTSGADALRVAA